MWLGRVIQARRLFAEVGNERQAEGSCLMRIGEILKDSNPPLAKTLLEEVSWVSLTIKYYGIDDRIHTN